MSKKKSECEHTSLKPAFDEEKAKTMTASQVRQTYPRAYGKCKECGWEGIMYASYAHYIYGDW